MATSAKGGFSKPAYGRSTTLSLIYKRKFLHDCYQNAFATVYRQRLPYRNYQDTSQGQQLKQQRLKQLQKRVEALGYQVQLFPLAASNLAP